MTTWAAWRCFGVHRYALQHDGRCMEWRCVNCGRWRDWHKPPPKRTALLTASCPSSRSQPTERQP